MARESSALILTDDNFASIVAGVEEGRIAYGNVRKVILLLVSSGAAEVLLFVLTTAAGLPVPLWPVQLLWLNLVTNGIQDVALAFEPGEGGELKRRPRAPEFVRPLESAAPLRWVARLRRSNRFRGERGGGCRSAARRITGRRTTPASGSPDVIWEPHEHARVGAKLVGRRHTKSGAPREPIFNRLMVERTLVSALVIALVSFFTYRWMLDHGWPVHQAQNGVLLLLVLFENIQAGNSRSEIASLFTLSPLKNRLLFVGTVVAQFLHVAAMYTPGVREVLHLEGVSARQWLVSLALAVTLFVVTEIHKLLIRQRAA